MNLPRLTLVKRLAFSLLLLRPIDSPPSERLMPTKLLPGASMMLPKPPPYLMGLKLTSRMPSTKRRKPSKLTLMLTMLKKLPVLLITLLNSKRLLQRPSTRKLRLLKKMPERPSLRL
jgi:hypothetical protein